MNFRKSLLGIAAAIALISAPVLAQTVPQVPLVGATDLFQDVVKGQPTSQAIYASALSIAGYQNTLPTQSNALIGGDATTNLFQRGTTGASVTTTATYGGPDRWFYWSGASTAMTVSRDTTAADLPAPSNYTAAFKMARTSGQTGVVPVCMAQEVESVNSTWFSNTFAEFDFHATAGSNFSAANSAVTAYIITGTGTDEGSQKLAFGLNAGGGGSTGWTGQANAVAGVTTISTTTNRYAVVGNIPSTATEIGVALCFTPVGTAGTNDYVAFAGLQLVRNASLASVAGLTVGQQCGTGAGQINCTSFDRRGQAVESVMQERYYYQITEATGPSGIAMCRAHSVTVAECFVNFPVTMRAVPTMTYTAGFATETTAAGGTLGACSGLATETTVAAVGAPQGIMVACTATTVPAAGTAGVLYNNGGSGAIKASAEL